MKHGSRDRGSLEWLLEKGVPQGILVGGVGFLWIGPLGLLGGFVAGMLVAIVVNALAGMFGSGVYSPRGTSTPYTKSFSHIEALEIRGDLDGAAAAWELEIAHQPQNAIVLVRAADFHLRARADAQTALGLYQRVRASGGGTNDLKRYVHQKIVDLHLGPLRNQGRAMVELRRLIDAFPGTREAESARAALADLKAERTDP